MFSFNSMNTGTVHRYSDLSSLNTFNGIPTDLDAGPRTHTIHSQIAWFKDCFSNTSNHECIFRDGMSSDTFFAYADRRICGIPATKYFRQLLELTPSRLQYVIFLLYSDYTVDDFRCSLPVLTTEDTTSTVASIEVERNFSFVAIEKPREWSSSKVTEWIDYLNRYNDNLSSIDTNNYYRYTRGGNDTLGINFSNTLTNRAQHLIRHMFGISQYILTPQNGRGQGAYQASRQVREWLSTNPGFSVSSINYLGGGSVRLRYVEVATPISQPTDPYYAIRRNIRDQKNYSASPNSYIPGNILMDGEKDPQLFGVELEVSTDYSVHQLADFQDRPFFICKQDGSVNGNKSFSQEMVTVPMSLAAQRYHWANFFDKINYNKFDVTRNTGNGMHVHVERAKISEEQLGHLAWFFVNKKNHEFLRVFSERTASSMNSYAPLPRYEETLYPNAIRAYRNAVSIASNLRGAINLSGGKPTIEFRLFKGIVSYAEMTKNFDFVEALLSWTSSGDLHFQSSTLRNFIQFVRSSDKSRWTTLKAYLDEINVDSLIFMSEEVSVSLPHGSAPSVILASIERQQIKITSQLLMELNERSNQYGKIRWAIKNGKIIYGEIPTGSRFASLNEELAKRRLGKLKPTKSV